MEQYTEAIKAQNESEAEKYNGSIKVKFDGMPSIKLESYQPDHKVGLWERLAIATRRRRFTLERDWILELRGIGYKSALNGRIRIPVRHSSSEEPIIFDGASIPLPWLVGLLTIGILRPLGITLVASIVHDYAYKYGTLQVATGDNGPFEELPIERHEADKLFRDIVGTVNRLPPVGYIAWLAIRIGWLWVPYNNRRFTGKKPIAEYVFALFVGFVVYLLLSNLGLNTLLVVLLVVYLSAYIVSLVLQHYLIRKS